MNVLDVLANILFVVPFIVLPFLLVNWVRYVKVGAENKSTFAPRPVRFPLMSVLLFVGPIIMVSVISEIMASRSRAEALSFLGGWSRNHTVYVNSQPSQDADRVVKALKEVAPQPAHHSHPTKRIRVEIESKDGNLILELGRDSSYGQEYWVFYPKYRATSENEIGRITTPVFDSY